MDFEDAGCEDGDSADSCNIFGSSYDADCDSGTSNCPLWGGGTNSGYTVGGTGDSLMGMQDDCANKDKVTVSFKLNFPNDTTEGIADGVAGLWGMPPNNGEVFSIHWDALAEEVGFWCGIGDIASSGVMSSLSDDTDYNIQVNYQSDGTDRSEEHTSELQSR